ncbi:phosphonate C-P lyase system protein PhnH [Rhodobacter sp. TJ_12]|uniref:phosphonate C-P lyase system protein PhnH n=1 Tax=Rhodobacter sp. TJ_12 TaxID=2029399 RepID=UPI001CC1AB89|nr:phosphonate C-P lyase system protein PhnH [Rhodobacter sp. TJ_12]MBZ4023137.1 phosphonate C-P lyase system protein PhnH [Rhodobacter sp. TJ_12]
MTEALSGGFADAPTDAARAFRALLEAMARPGRLQRLTQATPPAPLSVAAGTALLTLADSTTPLFLAPSHDTPLLRDWIAFHCAAPLCAPEQAVFALGRWEALPLARFALGTPDYPDRSVTVIVELEALEPPNALLSGPGIQTVQAAHLPEIAAFQANHARFPLGFDAYFCAGTRIAALPRATGVEAL